MQHADPVPGHRRRRRARLRPPRARRSDRLRLDAQARHRDARRQCRDAGQSRRHGDRDRRLGAAHRPRRVAAGHVAGRQPPRRRHGQAPRHRSRAARDRHGGPAPRRHGRDQGRDGRKPLPRNPRAAHLRRRVRSAAPDHRPRLAQGARAHEVAPPPGWPRPKGYSNGIGAHGRTIVHRRRGRLGRERDASSPTRSPASSRRCCATSSRSSPRTAPGPSTSSA